MSTPNPVSVFEQAAIPTAIQILEQVQTFVANMGPDPAQWALKFPGALQVLVGAIELQGPALAGAEAAALQAAANAKVAGWIASLKAKQA